MFSDRDLDVHGGGCDGVPDGLPGPLSLLPRAAPQVRAAHPPRAGAQGLRARGGARQGQDAGTSPQRVLTKSRVKGNQMKMH